MRPGHLVLRQPFRRMASSFFSDGVGYAELDNQTPVTGATVLNVGSVSKVMAVIAIMQLVEQGKVTLGDDIRTYVTAFPDKGTPITLRHIMTHTSGIRHYRDGEFGPNGLRSMRHFDDFEEAIQHFTEDPLLFAPGEHWLYSSHAFNLLQGVVEQASGVKFENYMRTYVWGAGRDAAQFVRCTVASRAATRTWVCACQRWGDS